MLHSRDLQPNQVHNLERQSLEVFLKELENKVNPSWYERSDEPDVEQLREVINADDIKQEAESFLTRYSENDMYIRKIDNLAKSSQTDVRQAARFLFTVERPFSNEDFRPWTEVQQGFFASLYISETGNWIERVPFEIAEDRKEGGSIGSYKESFSHMMKSSFSWHHNFSLLEEEAGIPVPSYQLVISELDDQVWPYFLVERIDGNNLKDLPSGHQLKHRIEDYRDKYEDIGISLAGGEFDDRLTNYVFHEPSDTVYLVDPNEGPEAIDTWNESPYVPNEWEEMCDPEYWI